MGCIFAVIALAIPRFMMFLAFLFTNWFGRSFDTKIWPILGFLFMPYTTLAYMAAMLNNHRNVTGGWLVLLIIAVVVDVGHWGGGYKARRK